MHNSYAQHKTHGVGLMWWVLFTWVSWKMMDLQHHHNNYTTPPHMGCDPVCGAHPYVRGCCAIVVPVKYKNQTPVSHPCVLCCVNNIFFYLKPISFLRNDQNTHDVQQWYNNKIHWGGI
jgi:hypothetical protein